MLITLLAWIYITFLCWTWGNILIDFIKRISGADLQDLQFSFICLTGLSVITIIAGFLSLLIPLGVWWVQLIFIFPSLLSLFTKKNLSFFTSIKNHIIGLHPASLLLFLPLQLLILVMSSWTIVHPDTLGYHAQTIQWIEKYKAVPGLVHLHVRFGYQGLWFVDNALFGFSFSGLSGVTFLNSTILLWFFIFIINRIDINFFKKGKRIYGLLWFILLSLSMWSYTQVRLTATSASPDFIATLFVLAITYLLLEKKVKHLAASDWVLAGFLSIVAVTIKLSVAPLLFFAVVAAFLILIKRKIKLFVTVLAIFIMGFTPFIARNIITSGYVVFPSTLVNIINVDWKYSKELTVNEKSYITAYAKKHGVSTKAEIDATNNMSLAEWLPNWWEQRSFADKAIIILLLLSFVAILLSIRKVLRSGFISVLIITTMLIGVIFWFINAPDPRFGFGPILGFISVTTYLLFKEKELSIAKNIFIALLIISSAAIWTYTGYRFIIFFKKDQWLTPLGIDKTEYTTYNCSGININVPSNNKEFGITPVPCTDVNCDKFSPRGSKITDGFRTK